jgi:glycosyltransferase involved in cell wall biosynthesis
LKVPNIHGECPADRGDRVLEALEALHRQHRLNLVLFPTLGGLGFRALQSRDAGVKLDGVRVAVYLDSCSAWIRHQQERWPEGPGDLEADYIERQAFERADVQLAPCPNLLQFVRQAGWAIHPNAPGTADEARAALLAELNAPRPPRLPSGKPLVTVCVPHFNLGDHLPAALASLAAQTYPRLEVLVIDDGSTEEASRRVFEAMQARYPAFRFLRQANAGIGATRNWGLREARGSYFVPMDADNVARPEMVERLVAGIHGRPELAALTCYFLAFAEDADLERGRFRYAYRPTGGPRVLASMRNVYGDATAIYRTEVFRSVGGYEPDRDTSFEDWEAFVKLAEAGHAIDVLPEHLFYYRHREGGFSRVTKQFANHERVLRRFRHMEDLPAVERAALWSALAGFHCRADRLSAQHQSLRYRLADTVYSACRQVPLATRALQWLRGLAGRAPVG